MGWLIRALFLFDFRTRKDRKARFADVFGGRRLRGAVELADSSEKVSALRKSARIKSDIGSLRAMIIAHISAAMQSNRMASYRKCFRGYYPPIWQK
jgi:hypothetical protein